MKERVTTTVEEDERIVGYSRILENTLRLKKDMRRFQEAVDKFNAGRGDHLEKRALVDQLRPPSSTLD